MDLNAEVTPAERRQPVCAYTLHFRNPLPKTTDFQYASMSKNKSGAAVPRPHIRRPRLRSRAPLHADLRRPLQARNWDALGEQAATVGAHLRLLFVFVIMQAVLPERALHAVRRLYFLVVTWAESTLATLEADRYVRELFGRSTIPRERLGRVTISRAAAG